MKREELSMAGSTDILRVNDVARALHIKPDTVWRWLRKGRLRGTKIGKLWFIPASEVERLKGKVAA
jgi:excisionase family DNA binding protein